MTTHVPEAQTVLPVQPIPPHRPNKGSVPLPVCVVAGAVLVEVVPGMEYVVNGSMGFEVSGSVRVKERVVIGVMDSEVSGSMRVKECVVIGSTDAVTEGRVTGTEVIGCIVTSDDVVCEVVDRVGRVGCTGRQRES